jgi:ribonucleoside-triphosphate reductase (formate)
VCEVFSRIVGYYRATKNWNTGKAQEFKERTTFTMPEETT